MQPLQPELHKFQQNQPKQPIFVLPNSLYNKATHLLAHHGGLGAALKIFYQLVSLPSHIKGVLLTDHIPASSYTMISIFIWCFGALIWRFFVWLFIVFFF
ncbi:unnamed protein product [Cuscuta epithymum]|uniref:Uncharacterized protein n=1 Tax=Cuscuta epithymum TaxID=186058 RepID=A0AAV0EC69_9ASTE|nr:unnamed protein product [Cuscuta epithymum]